MSRRRFIAGVVLAVTPLGATASAQEYNAQQAVKVPRIGYLSMLADTDSTLAPLRAAFWEGLREHGYIEGQTITIERRFADGSRERLPDLAAVF